MRRSAVPQAHRLGDRYAARGCTIRLDCGVSWPVVEFDSVDVDGVPSARAFEPETVEGQTKDEVAGQREHRSGGAVPVEEADIAHEGAGGAGRQELSEVPPGLGQQFRGAGQPGQRVAQQDEQDRGYAQTGPAEQFAQSQDGEACCGDAEHAGQAGEPVVAVERADEELQGGDNGQPADDGDPDGGGHPAARVGHQQHDDHCSHPAAQCQGQRAGCQSDALGVAGRKGAYVAQVCGAVRGVGDVLTDGLHHCGDGRAGGCRVEDVDIGRRVEHESAVDFAVRDRGPRVGLRGIDLDLDSVRSFLESNDLSGCADDTDRNVVCAGSGCRQGEGNH
ncbi:MAG TPA: hypothetical protein VEF72_19970 [Mycobacterium sp.]|nr:hypothetical protein [Mycobacterium sp.]